MLVLLYLERGVEYVFSLRARNALDHGEQAVESIITPEGSESRNLIGQPQPRLHFIGRTTANRILSHLLIISRISDVVVVVH